MATRKRYLADNITCGQRLIATRRQLGFSLDQLAKELKIPFKYLDDIERDDLAAIPGQEMAFNIARKYCERLGIDDVPCLDWLDVAYHKRQFAYQPIDSLRRWSKPQLIKWLLVGCLALIVGGFLLWRVQLIFLPPDLAILTPEDNFVTTEAQLIVSGQSAAESEITINNRPILADNTGHFAVTVDLQKGLNLIKITAKKRYSRTTTVERRVLFKD